MAKGRPELDMLASVDLFQGLTRKELDAVYSMSREQAFSEGAVVAAEGAAAGRFYLILDGKATVTVGELNRPLPARHDCDEQRECYRQRGEYRRHEPEIWDAFRVILAPTPRRERRVARGMECNRLGPERPQGVQEARLQ